MTAHPYSSGALPTVRLPAPPSVVLAYAMTATRETLRVGCVECGARGHDASVCRWRVEAPRLSAFEAAS